MVKSHAKVKCPIIAYTAYRHMLWIADREFEDSTTTDNEAKGIHYYLVNLLLL